MKKLLSLLVLLFYPLINVWPAPINLTGFEVGNATDGVLAGTSSIQTGTKRSGAYALRVNPVTTGSGSFRIGCPGADGVNAACSAATTFVRFYINFATIPASASEEIAQAADSSISTLKWALRITSGGKLAIYNTSNSLVATGATTLTTGTWYQIVVQSTTSASASAYSVTLNGTSELSGTMTQSSSNTGFVFFGKTADRNSQTVDYYYDDILIDNASSPLGGANVPLIPDANGSTQQCTVGTGSANFAEVDEIPTDDDTTYIQKSSSASQTCLMNLASSATSGIAASSSISGIKAYQNCREVTSVASATLLRIRSNSANSDSSTLNGTTSYAQQFRVLSTDPGTSTAITTSDLDQMEIGAADTAATDQVRCSTYRLFADFATPTPTPTATPTNTPLAGASRGLLGVGK